MKKHLIAAYVTTFCAFTVLGAALGCLELLIAAGGVAVIFVLVNIYFAVLAIVADIEKMQP